MNYRNTSNQDRITHERYLFYRSLGYSVKAAKVLSRLTYGDKTLARWIGQAKGAKRLIDLHDWLEEQTLSPEDALRAFFYDPHPETQANQSMQFSTAGQTSAPSPTVGISNLSYL